MVSNESIKFGFKPRSSNWTSLRLINIFRVGLTAIFFSQSFLQDSPLLIINNLSLYAWVSFAYLLLSLVLMLASWIDRRNFQHQISVQVYIDIIAIILLMHSCGGISSGLGTLLIIAIAVTGLLGKNSLATIFASLASIGLFGEYLYTTNFTFSSASSTQVGLLGAALFATALVTQSLTRSIRSSEAVIQQQKLDVANLSALNSEILQNMQSGVIALDSNDQVRHINDTAKNILPSRFSGYYQGLAVPFDIQTILPNIYNALLDWRDSSALSTSLLTYEKGSNDIQISFHKLHSASHQGTLIFMDDVSKLKQKMQQSKLASLGKLTANIAHEIRNPLGAISHAAQLLAENTELPSTDKRLTEIIKQHSNRINEIIEDILQMSRGRVASKDNIEINHWMNNFIDSFCLSGEASRDCFDLEMQDNNLQIEFDSSHLNRILTNLCSNAKIHGNADLPITLKVYNNETGSVCIEVADQGSGIKGDELDKIFEPFYTTSHKGSGLGLYIVSQLCDLNDSKISVDTNEHGGTSFIVCK
ncbi:MAG: hypothetical protein HOG41_04080 [Gammaproteobacteria bacterium]|jgi:two-component system sensor histidine kinase PilS (NtrC family)|nr:hypothetical protein [Gammaproteobacteria bacterium]MBT7047200.1 hypothetical protein [Gammaproteobacteria bacterium]